MNSPLRVGIVGTGGVAHQHLEGYHSVLGERVKVVAACDPRHDVLSAFANQYSIPGRYDSASSMIDSADLDIVVMLTPPAVRDEVIYPAIARGVNLLIEKPFATSGAKAVEYVAAAEAGGIQLAVSQNFRWFPEQQWLKRRLSASDVGALTYLEARSFQDRPQAPDQWRAAESKLEMAIFSVHLIDRVQWIAPGAPVTVSAVTRRPAESPLPGEQFTSLTVQFDDDMVANMTSSWMSKTLPVNDMRVDSVTGSAVVRRTHPMRGDAYATAKFGNDYVESEIFPELESDLNGTRSYGFSLLAFVDALEAGVSAPHSGRDNLRTMGIMEAAYLSAKRGGDTVSVMEALGSVQQLAKS